MARLLLLHNFGPQNFGAQSLHGIHGPLPPQSQSPIICFLPLLSYHIILFLPVSVARTGIARSFALKERLQRSISLLRTGETCSK